MVGAATLKLLQGLFDVEFSDAKMFDDSLKTEQAGYYDSLNLEQAWRIRWVFASLAECRQVQVFS
jgi:hypothetical protein